MVFWGKDANGYTTNYHNIGVTTGLSLTVENNRQTYRRLGWTDTANFNPSSSPSEEISSALILSSTDG